MSRRKKLSILIPAVIVLFLAAYAKHRFIDGKFDITGRLQSRSADEISGITASLVNPGIYYVHNDSGDTSRFFAITPKGKLVSTIYYKWDKPKHHRHDCEDIATGPGPVKGQHYIYIGDIGDNNSERRYITVYRIADQKKFADQKWVKTKAVYLHLTYPDGPKDAETLMVDPLEKLLYVVSKRRDSVGVYTASLNYKHGDTVRLTRRCRLFFKGIKPFKWITGGSISADGQHVVLKNYQRVYYWRREDNEPIWKTLQRKPIEPDYQEERLGEAIGFRPDGEGYYTTSEGVFSPIYYYKVPGYLGL